MGSAGLLHIVNVADADLISVGNNIYSIKAVPLHPSGTCTVPLKAGMIGSTLASEVYIVQYKQPRHLIG